MDFLHDEVDYESDDSQTSIPDSQPDTQTEGSPSRGSKTSSVVTRGSGVSSVRASRGSKLSAIRRRRGSRAVESGGSPVESSKETPRSREQDLSDDISWRDWRRVDVPGALVVKVDTRIRKCQVVKDFEAEYPTDMSAKAGELLDVIEVRPDGWWLCARHYGDGVNRNRNNRRQLRFDDNDDEDDDDDGDGEELNDARYSASGYIPGTYVNVVHPQDS